MPKIALALTLLAMSAGVAYAASDPIATRKALMEANGAAAGLSAAMLKGDMPYNPVAANAAIDTFLGVSKAVGSFFPEDSKTGDTEASPNIWSDHAGFEKELEKFEADAEAAKKAAGKHGPADLAAFKAAVTPVLSNCKACHQDYRIKR